jgi:outer membrane lipoprotein LolB
MRLRRKVLGLLSSLVLCACVTVPPASLVKKPWVERMQQLQDVQRWDLQGRAAGAVGTQGWQATLDWRQSAQIAEVRLAGPLGVGATGFKLTPQGLEYASTAPGPANPADYLQERLGFAPPFANLRFWLLGVPNPAQGFEFTANAADRAAMLSQDGWTIEYADYTSVGNDVLPKRFTLHRDAVRVRIAVDRWSLSP